ncbi:hypothetical protein M2352_004777 [Azospirillum fermentarium]|uniref:N-ATPase subunit AtpR n=1 Tax=Azospirillum fermentarium TaxID=1233114 RepID=UPI00222628FF|nr:ATP synthase subunit I [Azospirillum fermentarium]MCW2249117.1 hypothetical protein [Azospirillum fermentarium]
MSAPLDLSPLPILAGLAAGAAVGAVFFRALAAEVRLLLGGTCRGSQAADAAPAFEEEAERERVSGQRKHALAGVALHLGRFALAAGVFVVAAFQGAPVLLAALAGFEGARRVMLRRGRGS